MKAWIPNRSGILVAHARIALVVLAMSPLGASAQTITSFSPQSGPTGTSVTITGTGFSTTPASNVVYFGASLATVTLATGTELTVTAPAGSTYGPITVTVGGLTAFSAEPFNPTFADGGVINACSFSSPVNYSSGNFGYGLALGDLDGDGKTDIAVANAGLDAIQIFRNTSTSGTIDAGSLAASLDLTIGDEPYGVALSDIDNDGKLDIVSTSRVGNSMSVFRNISSPGALTAASFEARVDFTTTSLPFQVVCQDLDNDGKTDIAIAANNILSVWKNVSAPGAFNTSSLATRFDIPISSGGGLVIADLDVDGKPDLIGGAGLGSAIRVFRNIGTAGALSAGSFAASVDFTIAAWADNIAVGDLDDDNRPDIVASSWPGGSMSILKNTSTSGTIDATSFTAPITFSGHTEPRGVTITDFDGDGYPDIAVANQISGAVTIYKNLNTPGVITIASFAPRIDFTAGGNTRNVLGGDIDGDGRPEIIVTNWGGPPLSVVRNTVSTVVNHTITSFAPSSGAVGTGVVITGTNFDPVPANNSVRFNGTTAVVTGSTITSITTSVPAGATTGPIEVTIDCTTATSATNFLVRLPPIVTSFTPASGPIGTSITIDGSHFGATPASNIVYFGATRATVTAATPVQLTVTVPVGSTYQPISVLVGGLAGYSSTPFLVTFPGGGAIDPCSWATNVNFTTGTGPRSVAIGDLDGDGKSDLVTANFTSNTISVFRNTSTTGSITSASFAAKVDFTSGTQPLHVIIGDLDGDGKSDIAVTNFGNNSFSVYRNTSTSGVINASSFAARVNFATSAQPQSISIADLDNDGYPDIISSSFSTNSFGAHRNTGTPGVINATTFAARVNYTTGAGPTGNTVVDVDGDGKKDVVVQNDTSGTISVFRNTTALGAFTAASFAAPVAFTVGATPQGIDAGDLDADGKPDVIVTNSGSNTISVLRNTATTGVINAGSFASKVDFPTGAIPISAWISDLDGDGNPDMISSNSGGSSVSVFKNNMTGPISSSSFAAGVTFTTGASPWAKIGDLDGDGKPDVVTSNSTNMSVVHNMINAAAPAISSFAPAVGPLGSSVTITGTDFSPNPANNIVRFNGALAGVTASSSSSITATVPNAATSGTISVTVGCNTATSTGSFDFLPVPAIAGFSPASGPPGITVTIDGAFFNTTPANNIVYFGATRATVTGASATQLSVTVPQGSTFKPISITVGGMTGYSATPFIATFGPSGNVNACSVAPKVDFASGSRPADVCLADLNNDGKPDMATINDAAGSLSVFENTSTPGTVSFSAKVDYAAGLSCQGMDCGDVDGDGKIDVIAVSDGTAQVSVFRNTSTATISLAARVGFSTGSTPVSVTLGDLTGDGLPELAVVNATSGTVSIYRNMSTPGTIAFATRVDFAVGGNPNGVAIADIDGDGKPDVLTASRTGNFVSVFRNISTPVSIALQARVDLAAGSSTFGVAAGDIDGDGKLDIAATNYVTRTLSLFRNNNSPGSITAGSFDTRVDFVNHATSNPTHVSISDVSGDGKPDLLVGNDNGTVLQVHENTSTPGSITISSLAPKVDYTTGTRPYNAIAGDIDGDGRPEIMASSATSNTVSVLRNTILPPTIVNFSLSSGPPGTPVTIAGTDFSPIPANNTVRFNGTLAVVTASTATSITTTVPTGATTGPVTVMVTCNTALSPTNFTISPSCVPASERNALIALYNSTDGANWTDDTDWLTIDESTWTGVTIAGCHVTEMDLTNNNLVGPLPPELGDLSFLTELRLSSNHLTGSLPASITNLVDLSILDLSNNGTLSGPLPIDIGNLTSLRILNTQMNTFTGPIPASLANCVALEELRVGGNQHTGSIPSFLGSLTNLVTINLGSNQLTGSIPPELGDITTLQYLSIYGNQLSGNIPAELGDLINLVVLDISTNELSGSLPIELAQCSLLVNLNVANNQLTGTLPVEYESMTELLVFQINNNNFTGSLPSEYLAWTNIQELNLSSNKLSGMSALTAGSITSLAVENNHLEFDDLELNNGVPGYTYDPQANLPGALIPLLDGAAFNLTVSTGGTANEYQWYKDGVLIPGATSSTFNISAVAAADAGDYMLEITSTIVTGITLSTDPYVVVINPVITITLQPADVTTCPGGTATFTTNATGTTNITYQWQYSPNGPPAFSDISDGAGYTGTSTNTLSVAATTTFGEGRYRCRINGDFASEVITADEGLFLGVIPAPPTAPGVSRCGMGNITLTAAGGTNGQYRWYTTPTGGTAISGEVNDTHTILNLVATTNYYVTINNGTCESGPRTMATATINAVPTSPTAPGVSRCAAGDVTLTAAGGVNGQYRWYTTPTGGTAIFAEVNNTYTILNLAATTNYYVTIDNGTCERDPRVVATAKINAVPTSPTAPGISRCGTGDVTLIASGGVNGQYRWYTSATGGTAISGEANDIYTIAGLTTTTDYFVTVHNGNCESDPRTLVTAMITSVPPAPTTIGGAGCSPGPVTLSAAGGTNGQYRWYTVPSGGTAIAGEVNDTYIVPSLSTSTPYYVSINDGTCEGTRTVVIAQVNAVPAPPTAAGASGFAPASLVLTAGGGSDGAYRWYTTATGGTAIAGEANSLYTTPVLTAPVTYFVAIRSGTCESARTAVLADIKTNQPPVIASATSSTTIEGHVTLDLTTLISDADNNLDFATLRIVTPPLSGAGASIDAQNNLQLDYANISFSGTDRLTVEICDGAGACTQQEIIIEVIGDITVFNAVSPNGDGKNDLLYIQYIDLLASTQNNRVTIYNRWGDVVFETTDYNNADRAFTGRNKNGEVLPSGTYYYKIDFINGGAPRTGFISLQH